MSDLQRAREWVRRADAIVVAAGAGMGVDSGLPDFRGPEGFWNAYPPYRKLGLRFEQLANPRWFTEDPALAWGFYGHRLGLYTRTVPHEGFFAVLGVGKPVAVFTSNVDGQFQKAGYDNVYECHGSIYHNQCTDRCFELFPATPVAIAEDYRAREPFPRCPQCNALARPAILMFGDGAWNSSRTDSQERELKKFLHQNIVVIECGAGTSVPSVRHFSETAGAPLIRINLREAEVPRGQIGLAMGAKEGLIALTRPHA